MRSEMDFVAEISKAYSLLNALQERTIALTFWDFYTGVADFAGARNADTGEFPARAQTRGVSHCRNQLLRKCDARLQ